MTKKKRLTIPAAAVLFIVSFTVPAQSSQSQKIRRMREKVAAAFGNSHSYVLKLVDLFYLL